MRLALKINLPSQAIPLAGAVIALLLLVIVFGAAGPVWQINDDAYYAMLADGYGMVSEPVAAIPYLHPLVGLMLSLLRKVGLQPSYAFLLSMLLAMAAAVLGYSLARVRVGLLTWGLVVSAFILVALMMQYTITCCLLVASAAALLVSPAHPVPPIRDWVVSALLLWVAALLRVEMVVMGVICIFAPLFIRAWQMGLWRVWFLRFSLLFVFVFVGVLAADSIASNHRLDEFYRLNNPMAVLMNYGFIEALQIFRPPLPKPYQSIDVDLIARWFFADQSLMNPEGINKLVETVGAEQIFRVRYWMTINAVTDILSTQWFWILVAIVMLSAAARDRVAAGMGLLVFSLLFIASSLFLKPLPERVAVGMVIGLLFICVLQSEASWIYFANCRLSSRHIVLVPLLAALLSVSITDRKKVEATGTSWTSDRSEISSLERVYYFAGRLPLRSVFRPFADKQELGALIPLGSMYFTPEVLDGERAIACGGFIGCLLSGKDVHIIADDNDIRVLSNWLIGRHDRKIVVKKKVITGTFQLQTISAEKAD